MFDPLIVDIVINNFKNISPTLTKEQIIEVFDIRNSMKATANVIETWKKAEVKNKNEEYEILNNRNNPNLNILVEVTGQQYR